MKFVLSFLLLVLWMSPKTYDLTWKPKSGQELRYTLEVKGELSGADFRLASDLILKVKKVEANGDYLLGTTFKNLSMRLAGSEDKVLEEPEEVQRYDAKGQLIGESAQDSSDDLFGELLSQGSDITPPKSPVKLGQKWKVEYAAKPNLGLPRAETTYQLSEVREKDGRIKVTFDYHQMGDGKRMTAKGSIFLDGTDGSTLSVESKIDGMKLDADGSPGQVTVLMKLKDVR